MKKTDEIEQLDQEIEQALSVLNNRQRKFSLVLAEGNESQSEAAIKAGYTQNRAESTGCRLMTNGKVSNAVALLRRKYQLEHGISAAWKREKLEEIVTNSLAKGTPEYNVHGANQAIRTLCEMDGNYKALEVKHQHLKVNVSIGYDVQLPEREEKVIEHEKDD